MNTKYIRLLGRLVMAASLVMGLLSSSLGGIFDVAANSNFGKETYNDTHKAWKYEGAWAKTDARRAYDKQIHVSKAKGDSAKIKINGSRFTLIFGKSNDYGKLDVYVDGKKIKTINQNKAKTAHQQEWESPSLGNGTHEIKFVHTSGKLVNIDALTVRREKNNPDPKPTNNPAVTETAIPLSPVSPTSTLILSPSVTPSPLGIPNTETAIPVESPTQTPLSIPSASSTSTPIPLPSASPTVVVSQTVLASPTSIASATSTTAPIPIASSTPTISPTAIASITATGTSTPLVVPTSTATTTSTAIATATATAAQTFYVDSQKGSDSNDGSQSKPWKTIQKAINSVTSGSTVVVIAGNYPELISISKSNLRVIANGKATMKGFYVKGNNNLVRGFTITNPSSDYGIRVDGNNNLIENNDISNTMQDGIWFFGSGNVFAGNNIHDIVDRSKIKTDPHVDCFQTWGPAENIIFERNFCNHTNTYGSNQILMLENQNPPVRNITFRNNVLIMHDPGYSPLNFNRKSGQAEISNITIVNNTIIHLNGIGDYAIRFENVTGAIVANNVFIDYGTKSSSYVDIRGGSKITVNNNAIYKSDGVAPKGGPYPNDIWMQNLGLVNYKSYDFRLTSSSPLIDKGAKICSVVNDFGNNARPTGNGFDIGAFEYAAALNTKLCGP